MKLPGGLWRHGRRERTFAFHPPTGRLEWAIAEATATAATLPEMVSTTLATAIADIGDQPASLADVRALAVADRQHAVGCLSAFMGISRIWRSAVCVDCKDPFDFAIVPGEIPVTEGTDQPPELRWSTPAGEVRLRIPNGRDQEIISRLPTSLNERDLLKLCLLEGDPAVIDALSDTDVAVLDTAMEEIAPQIASIASARCPTCGADNQIEIDPYGALHGLGQDIFEDVHRIASHYHWGLDAILELPRARRQRFLKLIEADRGQAPGEPAESAALRYRWAS